LVAVEARGGSRVRVEEEMPNVYTLDVDGESVAGACVSWLLEL
jgi:hypothetical protein